ncbi:phosphotransferase enzyme family protein [soil metagenome]
MTVEPVFVFSILSPQTLASEVRQRYDMDITAARLLRSGLNDTYVLTDSAGIRYIARVYRLNGRSEDEVSFELDFVEHLESHGIGVCPAIRTTSGERVWPVACAEGERKVLLTRYALGDEIVLADHGAVTGFGEAVASLHTAAMDFVPSVTAPPLVMEQLLHQPLKTLRETGLVAPDNMSELDRIGEEIGSELSSLAAHDWTLRYCHGDLHGQNAHRSPDGKITHFDFDFSNQGWHAYDLAVFRWSAWINKDKDRWQHFLDGYAAHRPIESVPLKAFPLLAMLRHFSHMGMLCKLAPQSGSGFLNRVVIERQIKFMRGLMDEYASDSTLN